MRKLIATLLLCSFPGFSALPASLQFDARTTGSDTNNSGAFNPSGTSCGTDYSQQNSPQISYTDLVVGATTTNYTSVLSPVTSAVTCNTINVVSGVGCTTGLFYVSSETGGTPNFATVDRSLGTAASVCTAYLGGANATPCSSYSSGNCQAGAMAFAVAGNTINIKAGTYTMPSGGWTSQNKASNVVGTTWQGFSTTHGDITPACVAASTCTRPLLTTATTTTLFTNSAGNPGTTLKDLNMSATGAGNTIINESTSNAIITVFDCKLDISATSSTSNVFVQNSSGLGGLSAIFVANEFAMNSISASDGIADFGGNNSGIYAAWNYFHGGGNGFWDVNSGNGQRWNLLGNVFSGMSRGVYVQSSAAQVQMEGNDFYTITNQCVYVNSTIAVTAINNVFYACTYGIFSNSSSPAVTYSQNNAFGSIGTANYNNFPAGINSSDIGLSANPFTAPGSGNFALNATTGGGALLKAAGFPGVTSFGTGAAAIGALQPTSTGGASPHALVQ
jgi:hypothetical protein